MVSEQVRQRLKQPSFDCCQWEDEEILLLLQQMFLDLGLLVKFGISLAVLRNFLFEVYNNYNEIPFHNFRHCFCVAQMMYAIMWCVNLPSKIGDLEALILLTSCICHDLDHPGFNNIYQINARTELALRYNDISPLENHHCSMAFRILERAEMNIFQSLTGEVYRQVREGIIRCILATDMARHNEILAQFRDITPDFDYSNKAHVNLLSMVLIKVADISNEARPMDVAEPWLDRLLQEFFKQSDAEKLEGLPVTPFMDREKITKPSSQCSFIGFVLLPLFEALGELLDELQGMIVQPVREALDYYRRLNDAARDERSHRKSVVEASPSDSTVTSGESLAQSASAHSVRSRRSLPALALRARSRSTECEDDPALEAVSTEDLPEEVEDEETVTEVEVSEKALKFKISTEGSIGSGRKSYPGSRKGSRDKTLTQDCHMHELVRAMRDKDREYRRADSTREYSRVSSTSPVSSQGEAECLLEALHEDIATNQKAVHNGGADNIMLDNTCACKTCKMVGHGSLKKHEQAKHIKVSDDNDLREQVNETVSCCLDSCRGYGECRSGSIYDQSENATGTQCTARSAQEAILKSDCIITDVGKSGASQHHKSSILSRIRNFADKISFSSSSDKDGDGKTKHNHLLKSPSISAQSSPTTPKHDRRVLKIQSAVRDESPSTSSLTTIPQSDDGSKAMTLPKVKRSQRQNGNHRSWKLFLAGSKSGIPASSPELLSDTQFYQSPPNGKKHIFRNKTNASESSTPPHKSMQHTAEESGETSGGGKQEPAAKEESLVSGSLDSVLPGKRSSNHRNYKSSSGSKHAVLLARMGRSESDDSGCTSPRGHTWMSSLRQKKTKDQEHCRSAHALQD